MENFCIKTCRTCNKENFVFCDIYHEVIQKILKYIPNLVSNINFYVKKNHLNCQKKQATSTA